MVNTGGAAPVCWLNRMSDTDATGKTARTDAPPTEPITKSTGPGVECSICRWILARSALVLCVLKRLAATTLK